MKQTAMLHVQRVPIESLDKFDETLGKEEELILSIPPVLLSKAAKESHTKGIFNRIYLEENYISPEAIEIIKTNLKKGHITLFQEGFLHYCEGCFQEWKQKGGRENPNAWPDPFHEMYYCSYSGTLNHEERMADGRELIKGILVDLQADKLEKAFASPKGYCPLNIIAIKKLSMLY